MAKYAILSVWNKAGVVELGKELEALGYNILSTGGTAKTLTEAGVNVTYISDYTGSPEILDGRVKSLHPKIHGGILARKNLQDDLAQLAEHDISAIELVVVNLYPFTEKVSEVEEAGTVDHESLVESIDIGGPTMLRASAKNCHHVIPLCDPVDYSDVLSQLKVSGDVDLKTRQRLASKVFLTMSAYDGAIARYFSLEEQLLHEDGTAHQVTPMMSIALEKRMPLRYGENPHQKAGLYSPYVVGEGVPEPLWQQLQGKEISYNNLLDMQGALDLFLELTREQSKEVAVVIKHSNPCGAAIRDSNFEAFEAARACDPTSAFGGIIAVSGTVGAELASSITEGFVEVVLAADVSEDAKVVFAKKKNIRVLECDFAKMSSQLFSESLTVRQIGGDYLIQTADSTIKDSKACEVVSENKPSVQMQEDLEFAWRLCKHVKSNTIVIAKDGTAIGVGAGQMSRVDAAKIAIQRAAEHGHSIDGAVAASDAFLPFADTLEILNDAGVSALVQPGGSIKDSDVVASANSRNIVMALTGERHFRH